MKLSLCVHYSFERVYIAVVEPSISGLSIVNINSTEHGIDLVNPNDGGSLKGIEELGQILNDIGNKVSDIYITLPSDNVLVTQFPGKENLSGDDVRKLVNLEVKHTYPQYTNKDYTYNIVPLAPRLNGSRMIMAIITPNIIYSNAKKLLDSMKAPVIRTEISQLNAHSAFIYNYPEEIETTAAFFCVQGGFVDVSILKNRQPAYYNLQKYNNEDELPSICENEFNRIMTDYVDVVDSAYLFGSGLTKSMYDKTESILSFMVMKTARLNAFRMFASSFGERENEYCRRTYHIYPSCIGGVLPPSHERLKLY